MAPKPATDKTGSSNRNAQRVIDATTGLVGLQPDQWTQLPSEARVAIITGIDAQYRPYIKTFYATADACVERYNLFTLRHRRWRYTAIVGTGILAAANFAAAKQNIASWGNHTLPLVTSILALVLSVLANLETFGNSAEQAQAYRDSRELYLDAAQEFERAWDVSVVTLGDTAQAYFNAAELYKRIVIQDKELRRSFKDLK